MSDDAILIADLRKMIDNLLRLINDMNERKKVIVEKYYEGLETISTLEKEIVRLTGG